MSTFDDAFDSARRGLADWLRVVFLEEARLEGSCNEEARREFLAFARRLWVLGPQVQLVEGFEINLSPFEVIDTLSRDLYRVFTYFLVMFLLYASSRLPHPPRIVCFIRNCILFNRLGVLPKRFRYHFCIPRTRIPEPILSTVFHNSIYVKLNEYKVE